MGKVLTAPVVSVTIVLLYVTFVLRYLCQIHVTGNVRFFSYLFDLYANLESRHEAISPIP
jgi:hypothetical protein